MSVFNYDLVFMFQCLIFCHHLFTLEMFQSCMNFFLLLNKKEDFLKNVSNQSVPLLPVWKK